MLTLADLGAALDSRPIVLRKKPLTVRALSIATQVAIAKAFKLPDPPLAPARGKGSAAPFEPDYHAPEYRIAEIERVRKIRVVEAMAALNLAAPVRGTPTEPPHGGSQEAWNAYALAAWEAGSAPGGLSLEEVQLVQATLDAIGAADMVDDAKKDSGPAMTPSAPAGA